MPYIIHELGYTDLIILKEYVKHLSIPVQTVNQIGHKMSVRESINDTRIHLHVFGYIYYIFVVYIYIYIK
jgi:hypothetical protein